MGPDLALLRAVDNFSDLTIVGESTQRSLRKDQLSIDDDLEDAVRTLDQLGRSFEIAVQFSRQTGGSRFVISHHAVFDRNVHRPSTLASCILSDPPAPAPTDPFPRHKIQGSRYKAARPPQTSIPCPRQRGSVLHLASGWAAGVGATVPHLANSLLFGYLSPKWIHELQPDREPAPLRC